MTEECLPDVLLHLKTKVGPYIFKSEHYHDQDLHFSNARLLSSFRIGLGSGLKFKNSRRRAGPKQKLWVQQLCHDSVLRFGAS